MNKIVRFFLQLAFAFLIVENVTLSAEGGAPPPFYPFSLSGCYLDVNKAHFRTPEITQETIHYRQWDLAYAYTHPFSSTWGLIFGTGWVGTEVKMTENPLFDESIFNYVNFSLGAFTKACPDWTWTLTLSAYFDTAILSLIDYTLYQGVLWGRYTLNPCFELDFGLITEVGLSKRKVWPILGFVCNPFERLRLSVVYPLDVSLQYDILKCLSISGSLRFLRNRHRLDQNEIESQGIFEYRNTGAEFDLIINPFSTFSLKGFAGSTLGGELKITNHKDKDGVHFKFKGSFYGGVSAVFSY